MSKSPIVEQDKDYYTEEKFVPVTYQWVDKKGVRINGYLDNNNEPLYVWNDRGCEIGGGTSYADYITINDTIIYLRDITEITEDAT